MSVTTMRSRASKALRRIRHDDEGFSMVVVMIAVMMMTATMLVSMQSVDSDRPVARDDIMRKGAYAAAESGLQAYVHRLTKDASYWTQCTGSNPTGTTANGQNQTDAVNNWWPGPGSGKPDTRKWAALPDNTGRYTVEQLPANGVSVCKPTDPVGTMIDDDTATFRVRVTGQAIDEAGNEDGPRRAIIATFKRKSFLDYIYFTDLETLDPTLYPSRYAPGSTNTKENKGNNDIDGGTVALRPQRTVEQWGMHVCAKYAYQAAGNGKLRKDQTFAGSSSQKAGALIGGEWQNLTAACSNTNYENNGDIRFADTDYVKGPFHTNDTPMVCGSPNFGRNPTDAIETAAPGDAANTTLADSYRQDPSTNCGASKPDANFNGATDKTDRGTWLMNQGVIGLPPNNESMAKEAALSYTFSGNTTITLGTNTIRVDKGKRMSDGAVMNNTEMAYPLSGVIAVANDKTLGCTGYKSAAPYEARPGCGIASVSGTYAKSLSITAEDDILIVGHVKNAMPTQALLGLVAINFVRVQHKVQNQTACANEQKTGNLIGGYTDDLRIDAALLTLAHSFLVDNWACGSPMGDMTITGAIAQKFRGPVATGSGRSTASGYVKDYVYDDRLRTLSPPKFLDPVKASWRMKMYQEQSPAF